MDPFKLSFPRNAAECNNEHFGDYPCGTRPKAPLKGYCWLSNFYLSTTKLTFSLAHAVLLPSTPVNNLHVYLREFYFLVLWELSKSTNLQFYNSKIRRSHDSRIPRYDHHLTCILISRELYYIFSNTWLNFIAQHKIYIVRKFWNSKITRSAVKAPNSYNNPIKVYEFFDQTKNLNIPFVCPLAKTLNRTNPSGKTNYGIWFISGHTHTLLPTLSLYTHAWNNLYLRVGKTRIGKSPFYPSGYDFLGWHVYKFISTIKTFKSAHFMFYNRLICDTLCITSVIPQLLKKC